ncbi:MAG: hypothetical protein AAB343_00715 [Patescibacteria group bacterium]
MALEKHATEGVHLRPAHQHLASIHIPIKRPNHWRRKEVKALNDPMIQIAREIARSKAEAFTMELCCALFRRGIVSWYARSQPFDQKSRRSIDIYGKLMQTHGGTAFSIDVKSSRRVLTRRNLREERKRKILIFVPDQRAGRDEEADRLCKELLEFFSGAGIDKQAGMV